ncbi:hypothetical protein QOL99_04770, partial [Deinococcus sp. MIMF12]
GREPVPVVTAPASFGSAEPAPLPAAERLPGEVVGAGDGEAAVPPATWSGEALPGEPLGPE